MRHGLVAAVSVLVVAALCGPARAHGGASVVPVLGEVVPPLPAGVEVTVVASQVSALIEIHNPLDEVLEVAQVDGTPWLRISRAAVEVATGVADTYASTSPSGGTVPSDVAAGTAPNAWVRVNDVGEWAWFEHRLHPADLVLPRGALPGEQSSITLANWVVPVRLGDQTHEIRGTLELRTPLGAIQAALRSGPPQGLRVEVLSANVPGILASWAGPGVLVVLGRDGEPFLRFTATQVEVNVASATHREAELARGNPAPAFIAAGSGEHWERVAPTPTYAWVDPRTRPPIDLAADVTEGSEIVDLLAWDIPLEIDGVAATLVGVTRWMPFAASGSDRSRLPWFVAGAVVVGGVLLGVRRRGRPLR